jgi:hypothetical protein
MSGIKTTKFRIVDPERERRLREVQREKERIRQEKAERTRILANITQQQQTVTATSNKLRDLLKTTPQGLKETFGSSVQEAERWTDTVQNSIKNVDKSGSNAALKNQLGKINSQREEGQQYLKSLTKNFTQDADNMEKSVIDELLDLNSKFEGNKESINKWAGLDEVNKLAKDLSEAERYLKDKKLKDATNLKNRVAEHLNNQINSVNKFSAVFNQYEQEKELLKPWFDEEMRVIDKRFEESKVFLKQGKYDELARNLTEMQKNLEIKINEANELDEKDQKRNYVLESLKKVCNSMGFEEVGHSVDGTGKSNRIIYTIDTFSQGKIKFCLSLDSIDADSGIVDNHCMSEFDKVSESLQKNFGVQTKFKRVHDQTGPIKKRQGEIGGGGEDKVINNEGNRI